MSRFHIYKSLEDIERDISIIAKDTEAIKVIESLIEEIRGLESAVDSLQLMMWEGCR